MYEFKVGDRVKVGSRYGAWLGEEGVIIEIDNKAWPIGVNMDNHGRAQFDPEELDIV